VDGDPVRLNRVLLNLLSNAIKFTERGGVGVRAVLEGQVPSGMLLRVSVTDTGIGVAPAMQERIFEDFVQADDSIGRRFGGTGLGLAISRRLARLMGGELTLDSTLGASSTFSLHVPLSRADGEARVPDTMAPAAPLDVLLVDDDPVNREVGAALLRKLGHRPTTAEDGPTAVVRAKENRFDAVLMDLHMPGMDGIEAASLIRSLGGEPKPRIIALTADMSQSSRGRLAAAGIHNIVGKPVLIEALRAALSRPAGGAAIPPPAPAAVRACDGLIDEDFLADQQLLLGVTRLRDLQHLFEQTCIGLLQTIAACAEAGDRAAIQRSAHRLGSAASALGLARLFARCTAIEAEAAAMPADALSTLASELERLRISSIAAFDERLREHETV
jgi:CheY-like chemotaxis protein